MRFPCRPARRAPTSARRFEELEDRWAPAVSFQFDYSLDTNNFFSTQAKRDLLRAAGDMITTRFADTLTAVTPSGEDSWAPKITHPGTGAEANLSPNLSIPANVILVYAGGRNLAGPLGIGGPGAYSATGSTAWFNTLSGRGQSGALASPATDFAPTHGSITFDTVGPTWHFGTTTSGLTAGKSDFLSVALHELSHVLGYGTSDSWYTDVSGSVFTGASARASFGGNVPLSADASHWADGTKSGGVEAVMTPALLDGSRKLMTPLDFAGLKDIGWQVGTSPPVLNPVNDRNTDEGSLLTFPVSASDPDAPPEVLTYSADGLPPGASFNSTTGVFSWTPTEAQGPGNYPVTFTVSDGLLTDSETVTLTVAEVNAAPTLGAIGGKNVPEETPLTFTVSATDIDQPANTLTYSVTSALPGGATFEPTTRTFSWKPTETQGPGSYDVTFQVSDGSLTDSETITITVAEGNVAPVLAPIGGKSVGEGNPLTITASATDADRPNNALTYSVTSALPAGATFDSATRTFSWTPTETQGPGNYNVTFQVSDGSLSDSETVTITVTEVNTAPVLASIGSKSVNEGGPLTFTVAATDDDRPNNALSYSATGLPSGAGFNSVTRVFAWTPGEAQGPGSYSVTFQVSDGSLIDSEIVTITVAEVNTAPVLGPVGDRSVTATAPLSVTVTATDDDLPTNALTYSVTTPLPTGAVFDPATRTLHWVPTAADVGGIFTVTFSVSDGILSDSESITVNVLPAPPPAPILPSATRPLMGTLVRKKVGKRVRLYVQLRYADTSELKSELLSPLQKGQYTGIQVIAQDTDGDGVPDAVAVTGRKGRKLVTRVISG